MFADRKRRAVALLAAGVTLAIFAAVQVQRMTADVESRVGPLVNVVISEREVSAGKKITARNAAAYFSVVRVATRFAPKERFGDLSEMIGMRTASVIPNGTYPSYAAFGVQDGQKLSLRAGWRAVQVAAVGFDEIAPIEAGARVDVVVSGASRGGVTQLFLQDLEVGAVGRLATTPEAQESTHEARLVTLFARPKVAVRLAAVDNFAKEIRLLMRPPGDRRDAGRPITRAGSFAGGPR